MIWNDRLRKLREEHRYTLKEIASKLGVSEAMVSRHESNTKNIPYDIIEQYAKIYGCTPQYIMGWDGGSSHSGSAVHSEKSAVRIPVLGRVAAGIPINAIEETIDWEEIPAEMAKDGEYFGLRIRGDSMSPRIMDGDTVIVRRQDDADTGDIVIAIVNGNDGVCKKLRKTDSGIMLISLNPMYDPMVFDHSDIDTIPVSIIGRVVELRGKM